jgi:hypothetical protein
VFYSSATIGLLNNEYVKINAQFALLMEKYLSIKYKNTSAAEFSSHGFLRRVRTMRRCCDNIFTLYPPEASHLPSQEDLIDLGINLQSFVLNTYGCLDNLAWIWIREKQVKRKKQEPYPKQVSINANWLVETLPEPVQNLFQESDYKAWFKYIKETRDALVHRIPIYVPPRQMNQSEQQAYVKMVEQSNAALLNGHFEECERILNEGEKIGHFIPVMKHSFIEASPLVLFHAQILYDWSSINRIAEEMVRHL